MMLLVFFMLAAVAVYLVYSNHKQKAIPSTSTTFKYFQLRFLPCYYLMTASDWLQGPYVYALYNAYGFSMGEIGWLFIAGFASSMLMGTFVGGLADTVGRKRICLAYVALYLFSCITKHFNSFSILLLGRITGGVATSILFSAFDSWMVNEHFARGFQEEWLSYTFYLASFGNGIVAILAGIIASFLTEWTGSLTTPFDCAIVCLVVGGTIIALTWTENYGDRTVNIVKSFSNGLAAIRNNPTVLNLGLAQSLFESAMYIFVFMWTPTLTNAWGKGTFDHGMVFACFMIAVMIGSSLFNYAALTVPIEKILFAQFVFALCAMLVPIASGNGLLILLAFLVFEGSVGTFWPSVSTLKGKYIPEDVRSTVMNYFRLPTNFFVLSTLSYVEDLGQSTVFTICVILLAAAAAASYVVIHRETHPFYLSEYFGGKSIKGSDSQEESDLDSDDMFSEMMSKPTDV